MKRPILIAFVLGLIAPCLFGVYYTQSGVRIQPTYLVSPKCPWTLVAELDDPNTSFGVDDRAFGSIVAVTGSGYTLAYTAQTSVDSDPNWVVWKLPTDARTITLIAAADADADDAVVQVWACAGRYIGGTSSLSGSFQLGTTITWKAGTQVGPDSDVYCDTATTSDATFITLASDSGNDRIATVTFNVDGMDAIAFIGTTVDTKCDIFARWDY